MRFSILPSLVLLGLLAAAPPRAPSSPAQRGEFWAFTGPWDPRSQASVRAHGNKLDAVVTGWIGLDSITGRPLLPSPFPDTLRDRARTVRRMAIVTSWHGEGFHARSIRALAGDRVLLADVAGRIARHAASEGYRGLILDFETLEPGDLEVQLRVVKAISDSAHGRGISPVAVAIPAEDSAYPVRPLLRVADMVLVMLYDQHWTGSEPGPISDPAWFRRALQLRVAEAGASRVIAGLPTYGYRWRNGEPTQSVSFAEAQRIAAAARTPLLRDARTGTLRARRAGRWEMWVTDAELLERLVRESEALGVRRFALWRLGQEDPAIWQRVIH